MSDDQHFESVEKECVLEVINVSPYSAINLPIKKTIKQNNHQWRFQKIKRIQPQSFSPRKIETKNISFQTEQLIEISQTQQDSDQQSRFSVFSNKYGNCEQVYFKKNAVGTKWLGKKQYFASTFIDPNKLSNFDINSIFKTQNPQLLSSQHISFDSNFESGNLLSAYQVRKNQYDLILQNDINTKGNTQWFYFQIRNVPAKTKIKINIVNMLKSDSLFNYGMQPCLFSEKAHGSHGQGWVRSGSNIKYYRNENKVDGSNRYYYTLTFTVSTIYDMDNIRVAQCYPYTVSRLNEFLDRIEKKPGARAYIKRESAGVTLGKNSIEIIRIQQDNPRKKTSRNIIFVTARQHPGQTPGSFVCQGFINFILSDEKQAIFLRKNYEIIIFPMVNPDGVAVGNYRTNLSGLDLNRRWDGSKPKQTHELVFIKKFMTEIARGRQVSLLVDLHGHSRKLFSFFYGNSGIPDPISVRIFPYICAKHSDGCIRFQDSTFLCEEEKRRTARIQLGLKFKTPNIFTFETSFFGYVNKRRQKVHFTQQYFHYLGKALGTSLYIYQRSKVSPESAEALLVKKYCQQLRNKPQLIERGSKACSGSESEPEKGEIKDLEYKRLEENQEFNKKIEKEKISPKKVSRKQILVKEISKASRQLHVLDIARVNSIFPNDILALMPSSYGKKKKSSFPEKREIAIQTDEVPFIKIYDICKLQDISEEKPNFRNTFQKQMSQSTSPAKSNLFRTIIRPKSSSNAYLVEMGQNSPEKKEQKKRQQSGVLLYSNLQKKYISCLCQTTITFPPNADFSEKALDCMMINPLPKGDLLRKKVTNYSTINSLSSSQIEQQNKRSTQSFKIGLRALNVQTWRIKKRSIH